MAALGPVEARQVVIARCPRLAMLNGSEIRVREREDAEKAHARRVGDAFAAVEGVAALTDIFGTHSVGPQPEFSLLPPATGGASAPAPPPPDGAPGSTLVASAPAAFSRGADAGVIRGAGGAGSGGGANPCVRSPVALHAVSAPGSTRAYVPALDPWGLGASAQPAAGRLQALLPRFFMLAAKCVWAQGGGKGLHVRRSTFSARRSTLPSLLQIRPPCAVAGSRGRHLHARHVHRVAHAALHGGCKLHGGPRCEGAREGAPAGWTPCVPLQCTDNHAPRPTPPQRLPLSITVGAVKLLTAKLFKCNVEDQRLSFRDCPSSYPALLDDDLKPLSYYAVADGGELLMEEVDPAEAARQAAEAEAARLARVAAQAAQGEALRRAGDAAQAAQRVAAADAARIVK